MKTCTICGSNFAEYETTCGRCELEGHVQQKRDNDYARLEELLMRMAEVEPIAHSIQRLKCTSTLDKAHLLIRELRNAVVFYRSQVLKITTMQCPPVVVVEPSVVIVEPCKHTWVNKVSIPRIRGGVKQRCSTCGEERIKFTRREKRE